MMYQVDTALLASLTRKHRGEMTLREASEDITRSVGPVSTGTLLRVEQGKVPDLTVFVHLCNWLDVAPARLLYTAAPAPGAGFGASDRPAVAAEGTAATVVRLLRSDKRLEPAMANVLALMIQATYAQAAIEK